jgi:hypothetical protein
VKNAFRNYPECGILAYGFARLRARNMSETAAFLVDRVFPRQPVRQWVFSIPRLDRGRPQETGASCQVAKFARKISGLSFAGFASLRENPLPDGSTHLVLEQLEFLGKLAALILAPRAHLLRVRESTASWPLAKAPSPPRLL